MRRPWPALGRSATGKICFTIEEKAQKNSVRIAEEF